MRIDAVEAERIVPLRHRILRPEQPIEVVRYPSDDTPGSIHLAAFDGERIIGCATALVAQAPGRAEPAYQLRGMAVEPEYRNQGIGARLLARIELGVKAHGYPLIWCNGRVVAANFYRRHGWSEASDVFDIVGIPHHVFVKPLG